MKEQHKAILKELIAGKYPVDGAEEEKKEEPVSPEQLGQAPILSGLNLKMKKPKTRRWMIFFWITSCKGRRKNESGFSSLQAIGKRYRISERAG